MAVNIWHDPSSTIPKDGDSRIVRIEFGKSDIGATKSHLAKADKGKNSNMIRHVTSGK